MSNLEPQQPNHNHSHSTLHNMRVAIKAFLRGTYGTDAQMETKEEREKAMAAIGWMGEEAQLAKALYTGKERTSSTEPIMDVEEALEAIAEDLKQ